MNKSDIGRLAEEHGKYIYGFCLRLTNDTYNAEELYQDQSARKSVLNR